MCVTSTPVSLTLLQALSLYRSFVLGCMRSAECLVSAGCTPRPVAAVLHPGGSVRTPRFSLTAPVRLVGRWGCALLAVGRDASTVLRVNSDGCARVHLCVCG